MALPGVDELTCLIEPIAAAHGMDVERVRTVPAGKKSQVVVALDGETSPTLDELEEVSRELSELFDAREAAGELRFGAGYTLEVTTPGVDLPLTQPRHWRRNRGRVVSLADQRFRIGALNSDEDRVITIETGTKAPRVTPRPIAELRGAVVEVEFSEPPVPERELAELTFDQAEERSAE